MSSTQQARAFDGQWDGYTYSSAKNDVPEDYVGEFIAPLVASKCCVVLRRDHGNPCKPKRCQGRRCQWNPKRPDKAKHTCASHRTQEFKAREWAKGVGDE